MEQIQIMDEQTLMRSLTRITHEIIEQHEDLSSIVLLGIKSRGIEIAEIIKENLLKFANYDAPIGVLDATLYRDDLSNDFKADYVNQMDISFDINNKNVILIDDVLYTGRTIRASIEAVFSLGRPKRVELAVLIDRGHRELPIRPDYVGKNVPSSRMELIQVKIKPNDEETSVYIVK